MENDPANNPLPRDRDGDERMTRTDDNLVDVKPIKIYPFLIEELSEKNTRHWFYEMQSQLDAQNAWQVINLYNNERSEEYTRKMAKPIWQRVNKQANLIIGKGLSPTIWFEIKHMNKAGERWEYLRENFLTPNNVMKVMKLMKIAN